MTKILSCLLFVCLHSSAVEPEPIQVIESPPEISDEKASYDYLGGFELGYKYQTMEADYISDAYVNTTGLNIVSIKWKLAEASWLKDSFWAQVFIPDIYYEFTPSGSASQDQLVELTDENSDAWQQLALNFDLNMSELFSSNTTGSAFFLDVGYNTQSFLTTVQSNKDYWFVTNNNVELLIPGDTLSVATTFEEYRIGISVADSDKKGLKAGMGWFDMNYSKPLSSDVISTVERIYEADLTASGLYADIGFANDHTDIVFGLSYATEADVEILEGVSLGNFANDSGYNFEDLSSMEYFEYSVKAQTSARQFGLDFGLVLAAEYITRKFEGFVDDIKYNDDTIVNFSLQYQFQL